MVSLSSPSHLILEFVMDLIMSKREGGISSSTVHPLFPGQSDMKLVS